MSRILFFDTETTGKANFGKPGSDPIQPLPVQLGLILIEDRRAVAKANLLVHQPRPIEPKAQEVHGISAETARDCGVSLETALFVFDDLASKAHLIVAHNMNFDIRVMEQTYVATGHHDELWPTIAGVERFCTMHACTNILKLPKDKGYGGFKWPKLAECVRHFFNEEIDGAHDALVDVEACARVFFHLMDNYTGPKGS